MDLLTLAPAPPTTTRRPRPLAAACWVLGGAAIGATVGAIARGWMRLITDEPDFSWSGTIFIVIAFTITGAGHAIAWRARRHGHRRALVWLARVLAGVLTLPLFVGAGMMMFPTVVGAAAARWRRDWPRALRAVPAVIALPVPVVIVVDVLRSDVTAGRLLGLVLFAGTYALVVASLRAAVEPPYVPPAPRPPDRPARPARPARARPRRHTEATP